MVVQTSLNVDLWLHNAQHVIWAKQGDDDARRIRFHIFVNGQEFFMPTGAAAVFRARKPDGTGVFYDAQIDGNDIVVPLEAQVLACAGEVLCEINIYSEDQRVSTFNFLISVQSEPILDGEIESSDYFTALQGTISTIMRSATMVKPLGKYDSVAALAQAVSGMAVGDMYAVGAQAPFDFYFWDGTQWENAGALSGAPGEKGDPGDTGPYFTPSVDSAGNLSWSNNGQLENPQTVNIKGPKGDTGAGLEIKGTYASVSALEAGVLAPQAGDMYNVGTQAPYTVYLWDGVQAAWISQGQLQGAKGDTGDTGEPGPQGPVGPTGPQGEPGPNSVGTSTQSTITGLVKGANGYIAMAQAGADYELPTERLNMTGAAQTVTLADNTEYRFADTLTSLTITFPSGNFGAWLRFTAGSGFSLTMPDGATYIGGAPTWETGAQYEMSVKDGTSIIAKVEAAV